MRKVLLFVLCFITFVSYSQRKELADVNIDDFISETQISNDQTEHIELVWWMPAEYWEAVFSKDKYSNPEETKAIIDILKKHIVIIVVKGKVGMFGGITYETRESILSDLNVYYNGSSLKYIKQDNLEPDLKNFITMIGPLMKNMIGQMGENMQIFVYENDKKNPVDVWSDGKLLAELKDFKATIELPLSSLLQEKQCPEGKKLFSGKWNFCPFHGKKLVAKSD